MRKTAPAKTLEQLQSADEQTAADAGVLPNCVNLDEVLSSAVKLARDILKGDNASIAMADENGILTLRTHLGLSARFVSRWRMKSSDGLAGIVFRTGEPYASPDLLKEENCDGGPLTQEGIRSILAAPLKSGSQVTGCLCVSHRTPHAFSPDEVRLASLFADYVSLHIESATLLGQERQQRQRSEALLDVVSAPSLSLSLKKVLIKLCQSILAFTIGERCSIFIFNEETHTLDPIMSLGLEDPVLWGKFRGSAGLKIPDIRGIGEAIKAQEPVIEEHAPGSRVLPSFWIRGFRIKSLALYPLVHREKTIGMLEVDSFSKFVHFPAEEIETLAAIAKQAAVIIENARLYDRERRQHQRAEALVEVLTAAASTFSLKEVLVRVCRAVVAISAGDRCSIFLTDDEKQALTPVMSLGVEDEGLWQAFRNPAPGENTNVLPENRRLWEAVNKWEDPIIIEDAASTPLLSRWWVETFHLKSLVHYPLRVKDRTIGMMTVDAFRERVHFPQEEIDTLAAIAKQAAIIIENARLTEQLREQAVTDHLTGLFNHRHAQERLEEEFTRATRSKQPLTLMMMDLDNFKFFNDEYGHLKGDEALKFVGGMLRETLRTSDIVARYGGDEFLAILPETSREEAEKTGTRILETMANRPFRFEEHQTLLGMSIGVACYPQDSGVKQELLDLADVTLYEAKRLGGGRVVLAHVSELEFVPARSLGFGLLQGLLNALAHKDPYTRRHCEDNVRYVDTLAERLHLSETATESLRKAALLHDVGKIAIPDATLMKPGPLDSEEWEVMQQHVRFGEMIVKGIAQIADAIEPVATHHERYDGKGYPRGLKGDDIPLLGRILAVVDAYSAMTLDRPYRKALPKEEAVRELRRGAGTQFDPAVVEAFLATIQLGEEPQTRVA